MAGIRRLRPRSLRMIKSVQRLLPFVVLFSVGACGSSGTSPATDAATATEGGGADAVTTSKTITAATGGSVTLTGGSLWIPASALAADTASTVKESAPAADTPSKDLIDGLIYDIGP